MLGIRFIGLFTNKEKIRVPGALLQCCWSFPLPGPDNENYLTQKEQNKRGSYKYCFRNVGGKISGASIKKHQQRQEGVNQEDLPVNHQPFLLYEEINSSSHAKP